MYIVKSLWCIKIGYDSYNDSFFVCNMFCVDSIFKPNWRMETLLPWGHLQAWTITIRALKKWRLASLVYGTKPNRKLVRTGLKLSLHERFNTSIFTARRYA